METIEINIVETVERGYQTELRICSYVAEIESEKQSGDSEIRITGRDFK